jgi:spermidine synthase
VDTTIRAAGLFTTPYRVGGRDSGYAAGPDRTAGGATKAPADWGFILASPSRTGVRLGLAPQAPRLRTLTRAGLAADARAASRTRVVGGLPPSTLVHPRYAD